MGKEGVIMATLNANMVAQHGGFVTGLEKKAISWLSPDGDTITADVYVKPLSFAAVVKSLDNTAPRDEVYAHNIAASICDENGNPLFTVGDILGTSTPERGAMSRELTIALLSAIGETIKEKKH